MGAQTLAKDQELLPFPQLWKGNKIVNSDIMYKSPTVKNGFYASIMPGIVLQNLTLITTI